jgi:hypothetical protein
MTNEPSLSPSSRKLGSTTPPPQQQCALQINTEQETTFLMMEIEDEHFNLLTHELNIMHLIDKQCNNINDYIQYLKKYCDIK